MTALNKHGVITNGKIEDDMSPSIYIMGAMNERINYTLDQILTVKVEKPSEIPIELKRDLAAMPKFKTGHGPQDRPKKLSNYYSNSWITGVPIMDMEEYCE